MLWRSTTLPTPHPIYNPEHYIKYLTDLSITPSNMSKSSSIPHSFPTIHLLCASPVHKSALESARHTYALPTFIKIEYHLTTLAELSQSLTFDAIVSPANSYAHMDGGFDHDLSLAFAPEGGDYLALTKVAREAIFREWRGFVPPGNCVLFSLRDSRLKGGDGRTAVIEDDVHADDTSRGEKDDRGSEKRISNGRPWNCKYIALCPTMRRPGNVRWDREVVYECVWSLLAAVDKHNRGAGGTAYAMSGGEGTEGGASEEEQIRSVLMTPLATGYGEWGPEPWAAQVVLAMKHFAEVMANERRWVVMGPVRMMTHVQEVEKTHEA